MIKVCAPHRHPQNSEGWAAASCPLRVSRVPQKKGRSQNTWAGPTAAPAKEQLPRNSETREGQPRPVKDHLPPRDAHQITRGEVDLRSHFMPAC